MRPRAPRPPTSAEKKTPKKSAARKATRFDLSSCHTGLSSLLGVEAAGRGVGSEAHAVKDCRGEKGGQPRGARAPASRRRDASRPMTETEPLVLLCPTSYEPLIYTALSRVRDPIVRPPYAPYCKGNARTRRNERRDKRERRLSYYGTHGRAETRRSIAL